MFNDAMAQLDMAVEAYHAQLAVIQNHDATDRLGQIKVPTLVLAGEEDILIPVRLSKRLHAAIPGAKWATVPGGHACLWETPDPFNKTLPRLCRQQRRLTFSSRKDMSHVQIEVDTSEDEFRLQGTCHGARAALSLGLCRCGRRQRDGADRSKTAVTCAPR